MDCMKMLAIDLGSSGGKAFVGILENKKLTMTEVHRFTNDSVMINGNLYWDILRLFHEIKVSFQMSYLRGHRDIRSIGIDTWGVDFGLIDENGNLIDNPRHYRDMLKKDSVQEVTKLIDPNELYERTGTSIRWTNSLMQLHSLNKHCPSQLTRSETLLLLPDLLNYFLCGEKRTEMTIASTSQMLNIHNLNWDIELLNKLHLPTDHLAELIRPGTILGTLSDSVADDFNVKKLSVVSVAGHDTECAFSVIPLDNNNISISCGTWALLGIELDKPILSELSKSFDFTNEQCVDGKILYHKIINGLWLIQECKKEWAQNGNDISYDDLENAVKTVKPLISIINPAYQSFEEKGNIIKKIEEYCTLTNQTVPKTNEEVYVCLLQSLALEFKSTIDELERVTERSFQSIHLVGGGAKSKTLCQFITDAAHKKVVAGPYEATAIGNILIQGLALQEVSDIKELKEIVAKSFKTKTYLPMDSRSWEAAYENYKDLM